MKLTETWWNEERNEYEAYCEDCCRDFDASSSDGCMGEARLHDCEYPVKCDISKYGMGWGVISGDREFSAFGLTWQQAMDAASAYLCRPNGYDRYDPWR